MIRILLLALAALFIVVPPARGQPAGPVCWATGITTGTGTGTSAHRLHFVTGTGTGTDTGTATVVYATSVRTHTVTDLATAGDGDCAPPTLSACANAHYVLVPILFGLSIVGIALGFSLCVELYWMRRYRKENGC